MKGDSFILDVTVLCKYSSNQENRELIKTCTLECVSKM